MWEVVKADFKAASRRLEELVFIAVAGVAAGVLGSFAGGASVYLVALLMSQIAAYLYVIRDWDRGVLEGLIYYIGHVGVYVSKLVVTSTVALASTALACLFINISYLPSAAVGALLLSATSSLAALFAVYGGLPPPAATAMSLVLALPLVVRVVEGGFVVSLAMVAVVVGMGVIVSALLDKV
ncbi:hypothetical protein [Pyrobaculum ferrireducens]|uniref:Uncharacterized protein n=1 Tax=Pyrobaculum ferrireducens TaxID=1104324 RepID=G7VGK1_9CREN|nr:hypothetical protein [Pyrobaculum ferrireducens]AET33101.1 hypothetical protein P186_1687 [Pyrobaculum ferrireducens]